MLIILFGTMRPVRRRQIGLFLFWFERCLCSFGPVELVTYFASALFIAKHAASNAEWAAFFLSTGNAFDRKEEQRAFEILGVHYVSIMSSWHAYSG